jgi:putative ABC transport system permease protein
MSFLGLVAKNLGRQPVRAGLTLLGIALGITTVVALGVIAAGLGDTATALVRSGDADFMVAQEGAADLTFSTLSEDTVTEVADRPDVAQARGVLFHITTVGDNPFFFLNGARAADLAAQPPDLTAGRTVDEAELDVVLLGGRAADNLDAGLGDTVEIDDRPMEVVGLYRSQVLWEDSGAIAPLATVQELANSPDAVTVVYVQVAEDAEPATVIDDLTAEVEGVVAITGAGDYNQVDQGFEFVNGANVAISLLAVIIGGIGVMNTMVMSVFERTREIGVLRAVGWTGKRVMGMIMLEALLLCLAAAAVGIGLGVGVSRLVVLVPAASGFLEPAYDVGVFARALVVGVVVALAGAAYPAFRATRLSPMEALGYE